MLKIVMDPETVNTLLNSGYRLYSFKAVKNSDAAGRPLVWGSTDKLSVNTYLTWSSIFNAYTSHSEIKKDSRILLGALTAIKLGELWVVNNTGTGDVLNNGAKMGISIKSDADRIFTCGLAQKQESSPSEAPYCAFPLYPGFTQVIMPLDKIMLFFSTANIVTGTVVTGSFLDLIDNAVSAVQQKSMVVVEKITISPGILIDIAALEDPEVNFNFTKGWTWQPGINAQKISSTDNLVPLLIETE